MRKLNQLIDDTLVLERIFIGGLQLDIHMLDEEKIL